MIEPSPELLVAERIDAVCDQFEQDFRGERRPSIEVCVASAAEGVRAALFRALLELEIELRDNAGETPQVAEYEARFPQAAKTVRAVFEGAVRDQATVSSVTGAGLETSRSSGQRVKRPSTADQPAPLKQLGRFQIKSVLGEGAFGTVYRAYDPQLDRDVAVKVPRFAGQQSLEDRQRFLREARAAAGLHQANICPVHEVGTINGRDFIVLAFIDGKPLSKLLQTQPKLSDRQIAAVVRKLAAALQEAHDQGIIHRDLKPANIMINRKGEPVIMDFGLARRSLSGDAQISHSGQIVGTPAYMSPEQARGDGKNVDLRTDVYSLGIVLYELICGRRPFEGTVTEVIGQILHTEPPPPSQFSNTVHPELQAICLKAITKNPAERFASMKEFAAALIGYARALPTGERPTLAPTAQSEKGPSTNQFADLLAAISSDVESKVERAVRRAERPARVPFWTYIAGSGLMGLVVLLGIFFFVRKDTVTVIVNIPIDVSDPSFSFVLDKIPIAADAFATPFELKPGDHELIVNKDGKLYKHFRFHVDAGMAKDALIPEDVTPRSVTPEEILAGLQGRWIAIEQSRGGARLTADELKAENKVLTINENRFSMEYQLPQNSARRGEEKGAITRIDPAASPAEIDMVFERGVGGPLLLKGIFELRGNRLIHCYRKCHEAACARPVDYTTVKGEAVFHVVYEKASSPAIDWIDLFNGKDLAGWTVHLSDGKQPPTPWTFDADRKVVMARALGQPGGGHSWLETAQTFGDFELSLEWRFPPGASVGVNGSGIVILANGLNAINFDPKGVEIDVRTTRNKDLGIGNGCFLTYDSVLHTDQGTTPAVGNGNINTLKEPVVHLDGQWNSTLISCRQGRIQVSLNNELVNEATTSTTSGKICLRNQNTDVEFREVRIRQLTTAANVPGDSHQFNGHSYKFFPEQLSWKAAKARCEALGGHLVIIETPAENAFLATLIAAGSNDSSWIGGTDEGTEGKWRWVNGQPLTWTNWFTRQGQPNNKGAGEHFALISNKRLANGLSIEWEWSDQPNESGPAHQPGYLCEWDATPNGKP